MFLPIVLCFIFESKTSENVHRINQGERYPMYYDQTHLVPAPYYVGSVRQNPNMSHMGGVAYQQLDLHGRPTCHFTPDEKVMGERIRGGIANTDIQFTGEYMGWPSFVSKEALLVACEDRQDIGYEDLTALTSLRVAEKVLIEDEFEKRLKIEEQCLPFDRTPSGYSFYTGEENHQKDQFKSKPVEFNLSNNLQDDTTSFQKKNSKEFCDLKESKQLSKTKDKDSNDQLSDVEEISKERNEFFGASGMEKKQSINRNAMQAQAAQTFDRKKGLQRKTSKTCYEEQKGHLSGNNNRVFEKKSKECPLSSASPMQGGTNHVVMVPTHCPPYLPRIYVDDYLNYRRFKEEQVIISPFDPKYKIEKDRRLKEKIDECKVIFDEIDYNLKNFRGKELEAIQSRMRRENIFSIRELINFSCGKWRDEASTPIPLSFTDYTLRHRYNLYLSEARDARADFNLLPRIRAIKDYLLGFNYTDAVLQRNCNFDGARISFRDALCRLARNDSFNPIGEILTKWINDQTETPSFRYLFNISELTSRFYQSELTIKDWKKDIQIKVKVPYIDNCVWLSISKEHDAYAFSGYVIQKYGYEDFAVLNFEPCF